MTISIRRGTAADLQACFQLLEATVGDLARRHNYDYSFTPDDPVLWARRRPLYEHIAATAEHWWVAEAAGQLIGYARSTLHDGVRELTEFFVRPGRQSAGLGRELLARAFPPEGARRRVIVATSDERALARYLKAGVYPRFPVFNFRRKPEAAPVATDLEFVPMSQHPAAAAAIAALDRQVIGFERPQDHAWIATQRAGYLYVRSGQVAGYGYAGDDNGPFVLLSPADYPAVLAHAEGAAHARGLADVGFEVPLINRAAVDHLLARSYRMERFFAFFMSDEPLGQFENYVLFSPPVFL